MRQGWMNMTGYKRGDVVLVRYPHSDLMTFKKRPALIVQDDRIKTGLEQRIIVQITSNVNRTGPSRVPVHEFRRDTRGFSPGRNGAERNS